MFIQLHCIDYHTLTHTTNLHTFSYINVFIQCYIVSIVTHSLTPLTYMYTHVQLHVFIQLHCIDSHTLLTPLSYTQFLEQIHSQRMQKGVSEMFLRLYSPFLWRSLKVANPEVRANACTLLLDAFPLQDPDSTREDIDGVMQKQFDAMVVSHCS